MEADVVDDSVRQVAFSIGADDWVGVTSEEGRGNVDGGGFAVVSDKRDILLEHLEFVITEGGNLGDLEVVRRRGEVGRVLRIRKFVGEFVENFSDGGVDLLLDFNILLVDGRFSEHSASWGCVKKGTLLEFDKGVLGKRESLNAFLDIKVGV